MATENKITYTHKLMSYIISKGGLYADIARLYIDNHENSVMFILECSKQCHSNIAQLYWGDDLTDEIKKYKKTYDN